VPSTYAIDRPFGDHTGSSPLLEIGVTVPRAGSPIAIPSGDASHATDIESGDHERGVKHPRSVRRPVPSRFHHRKAALSVKGYKRSVGRRERRRIVDRVLGQFRQPGPVQVDRIDIGIAVAIAGKNDHVLRWPARRGRSAAGAGGDETAKAEREAKANAPRLDGSATTRRGQAAETLPLIAGPRKRCP
jgi:hypothetical protein